MRPGMLPALPPLPFPLCNWAAPSLHLEPSLACAVSQRGMHSSAQLLRPATLAQGPAVQQPLPHLTSWQVQVKQVLYIGSAVFGCR